MSAPHTSSRRLSRLVIVACACLLVVGTRAGALRAQTSPAQDQFMPEVARGVELYTKGDFKAAVEAFKRATKTDKTDADAWHFLGLSYQRQGKSNDARKAFEKSIGLSFTRFSHNFPAASIGEYESLSLEERKARRARLAAHYERAAEAIANYVQLQPKDAGEWHGWIETAQAYAKGLAAEREQDAFFFTPDVSQKAKILSRAEPLYTEEARKKRVTGSVRLRMVLASDGNVRHILVLKALPEGLTEMAINAARRIKFTPAMKDGRPVSQYTTMDYNFNLY